MCHIIIISYTSLSVWNCLNYRNVLKINPFIRKNEDGSLKSSRNHLRYNFRSSDLNVQKIRFIDKFTWYYIENLIKFQRREKLDRCSLVSRKINELLIILVSLLSTVSLRTQYLHINLSATPQTHHTTINFAIIVSCKRKTFPPIINISTTTSQSIPLSSKRTAASLIQKRDPRTARPRPVKFAYRIASRASLMLLLRSHAQVRILRLHLPRPTRVLVLLASGWQNNLNAAAWISMIARVRNARCSFECTPRMEL